MSGALSKMCLSFFGIEPVHPRLEPWKSTDAGLASGVTERLLLNLRMAVQKPDDMGMFSVSVTRPMTFAEDSR
ncbi:hypothetical protein AURDEDRAFT_155185 [Auricularia subglabra TFB-10046 SS5]|nr:hypothetical protein AURDEDRAFT_155185 [Auricularia subglabra TFB-10046 SS5]